ncbi:D-glycerate dehydrogenase [Candidatus Woesebacteria bacterium RIFCSPLOWO2_01_FULL_39_10]|uniref:D-glycerate dehydrogenase n=1 Tax=Candidatus Woesebacteria bacterium RIFCSPLOWO2_01_FULL_39_10 TaxID=1802516 RepID=A0A1F8B433_9BACT|nr:MAG: D-glycerate dehydrogenase [Candidatus Woesebacteria bacterium RIFCSPLOWO2_01_FULL_39_10]
MAKIFVTRKFPGSALDRLLNSGNEVEVSAFDRPLTAEELLEKGKGVDALLTLLTDKINGDVVDAIGPQLKVVSNYAVGFDNINVEEVTQRGVLVANTPCDEVNEAVAEHSWALMLALARRVVEADESVKRGAYKGWEPNIFLGVNMAGKTLGIVGLGRIGIMVAERAKGWNMRVLYNKRSRDEEAEKKFGVEYADLDTLLATSNVVTLHVPLSDETFHLINKDKLGKMMNGSFLINTARGPIVDEHDLADALRTGHLGGAGIDVFETEPNVNPELIGMENVILTPHIASATWEAREKMGNLAVDAILKTLNGEKPENLVSEEVWEKRRK